MGWPGVGFIRWTLDPDNQLLAAYDPLCRSVAVGQGAPRKDVVRAMDEEPASTTRARVIWPAPVLLVVASVAFTLAARGNGPFPGERDLTLWMHRNSPTPVDMMGAALDPLVTDLTAPLVFAGIFLTTWWRWGRHSATVLGLAGAFTALTRIGDIVERPRPTATGSWTDHHFGNGGYPSGHVVFTVLVLGTVALLARRHSSPVMVRRLTVLAVALVAVTAWTRISDLKHWPLDVFGALTMSTAALYGVSYVECRLDGLTTGRTRLRGLLGLPS